MGTETKYTHRHLARFIIEAVTPLAIGSGQSDIFSDALVIRDVNGLPYIPGSSLAGIVRSMLPEEEAKLIFGYQEGNGGEGSKIIFTEGKMLDSQGRIMDNLQELGNCDDEIIKICKHLPIRQHVKIGPDGIGVDAGKFDEEVTYKGTRFCFEVEYLCSETESSVFDRILSIIQNQSLRIGGGTRSGFGEVKVVDMKTAALDLTDAGDLKLYLEKSSDLNAHWDGWKDTSVSATVSDAWHEYRLMLQPRDFFLFASGFGDSDADITPVKESVIIWKDGEKATIANNVVLVPATSIKGAISHRTAFHWNKENNLYIGNPDARTCEENEAVKALFGYQNDNDIKRGNVLFSDMYLSDDSLSDKVQHHVKIDRFTGGAISGALYQEKVVYGPESILKTTIYVSKSVPEEYIKSFEAALRDVASGMLPLGGAVNRGHGIFTGTVEKNGEPLN